MSTFASGDAQHSNGGVRRFNEVDALESHRDTSYSSESQLADCAIGHFLRAALRLTDEQMEQILGYQRERGIRFGDAAVALRFARQDDVLWALSQQFHYPYAKVDATSFSSELVSAVNPFSDQAEALRDLRSQLLLGVMATSEVQRRALAIVSARPGDGKTFLAANIAIAFSQLGGRTLLLDADMRAPRQHKLFRISAGIGLSTVLAGRHEATFHSVPQLPNLYVLPVGTLPPNPLELLQQPAFGLLLHKILAKFDYVIVDTPAMVHGADGLVAASKCGAALAIGRRHVTPLADLDKLIRSLGKGPTVMAGVLINEY